MRCFQKLAALVLILALALPLAVPAFAADFRFSDVADGAPYAEAVNWAAEQGYINGYNDGRFGVSDNVTRAQLAAIFYRAAGSPAASGAARFSDVVPSAYYVSAASWAADSGLINGYSDRRFGVGDPVTRQQVAAILWRWAGSPSASGEDYADEDSISAYARTAVDWSRSNHVIAARSGGRFDPQASASRVEIASALYQYMNLPKDGETPAPAPAPEPEAAGDGKVLVAYFSATNNTENVANHLKDILSADLYEITPETPYTAADLDYNSDCRANREQNDAGARPAISGRVEDMELYDVIFLGYPIWWGQAPKIISTFLESYDLSGKTIVPFCTSGSSGIGSSATNLHFLAGSATWLDGQRFSGGASRSTVEAWVNGLGLTLTPAA
ncbi:flavodoxin [Oscillibacter sp.]|uniref:flavodoxin n=1 Tax=Oscillibacter sp. TaxID=1945593 RepID=UPI002D7E2CCA|nr:flavodoxin [Oscillibacter sp.]